MYCSNCGLEIPDGAKFCSSCGTQTAQQQATDIKATEELVQCPKCYSTQLTANQKGFSAGKAIGGAFLTGGVGLLAGFHGSKDVMITCMACGHEFKAGEGIVSKPQVKLLEGIDSVLYDLIKRKDYTLAVKACMEAKKLSISEASDYLKKFADENGIKYEIGSSSNSGCAGVMAIFIVLGGLISFLIIK